MELPVREHTSPFAKYASLPRLHGAIRDRDSEFANWRATTSVAQAPQRRDSSSSPPCIPVDSTLLAMTGRRNSRTVWVAPSSGNLHCCLHLYQWLFAKIGNRVPRLLRGLRVEVFTISKRKLSVTTFSIKRAQSVSLRPNDNLRSRLVTPAHASSDWRHVVLALTVHTESGSRHGVKSRLWYRSAAPFAIGHFVDHYSTFLTGMQQLFLTSRRRTLSFCLHPSC